MKTLSNQTEIKPIHLTVCSDGALYDTRKPNWETKPLREFHTYAFREIQNTRQLKSSIRIPYAWPGGYEVVFIANDGEILCRSCVIENLRNILDSIRHDIRDGWKIVGCAIEAVSAECARECDPDLVSHCAHCNKEFGELV